MNLIYSIYAKYTRHSSSLIIFYQMEANQNLINKMKLENLLINIVGFRKSITSFSLKDNTVIDHVVTTNR